LPAASSRWAPESQRSNKIVDRLAGDQSPATDLDGAQLSGVKQLIEQSATDTEFSERLLDGQKPRHRLGAEGLVLRISHRD